MADYTSSPYGRQNYRSSISASSSNHHSSAENGVDVDTVDYWDQTGVPAPHLLSTAHSVSPYPAHSSPRHTAYNSVNDDEMQELHSAPSGYIHHHQQASPFLPTLPSAPESLGSNAYMPSFESRDSLYHKPPFDDDEESLFSRRNSTDAWGLYDAQHEGARTSLAQARDRYITRKEAALSAAGNVYDFKPPKPSRFSSRQKWWMIAGGSMTTAIVCAIVIFFATRHNTNATIVDGPQNTSTNNNNNNAKGGNPTAGVVASDKNDPSLFTKDPRLHKSMYGLCYTPFHAQYPECGATQANVTEDIQLISQLTSRVRLYGSDCQTSQLVLEAIKQTKVDMQVFLAVWVDDNPVTFQRQVSNVVDAIKQYGAAQIAGVTVGNEYLLNGGSVSTLLSRIASVNTTVNGLPNLSKYIPIGTADAGSMVSLQLASGADYIMANVHPWFGGLPVDQAAGWIYEYTNNNEPSTALSAPNKPTLYVAEAGWPTGANETRLESYQAATAGIDQLNTFLSTFVCQSNANFTANALQPSFIFEAFDEPWKDALYGGVEAHWGLFDSNKKLKQGLVIPDCIAP